jgi:hypothetical protein
MFLCFYAFVVVVVVVVVVVADHFPALVPATVVAACGRHHHPRSFLPPSKHRLLPIQHIPAIWYTNRRCFVDGFSFSSFFSLSSLSVFSHSLSCKLTHTLTHTRAHALFLSLSLSLSLFLSASLSLPLCLSLSLPLFLSISISFSLCLCASLPLSSSLPLYPSLFCFVFVSSSLSEFAFLHSHCQMHPVDRTLADMFQVLGRLLLLDMQPDEDMFRDLLWICGRYRKVAEAKEIIAIMRRLGCPPSQATYVWELLVLQVSRVGSA